MLYTLVSIYDEAAVLWTTPQCFISEAEALREWQHRLQNDKSVFTSHPQDFSLWSIGLFNPVEGTVSVISNLSRKKIADFTSLISVEV
ncbi:nonstructural protein [Capybara microvirus Cap1_SP_143]|nr:nonstructural protein [Capybara microvirus Cap1_SP_143]